MSFRSLMVPSGSGYKLHGAIPVHEAPSSAGGLCPHKNCSRIRQDHVFGADVPQQGVSRSLSSLSSQLRCLIPGTGIPVGRFFFLCMMQNAVHAVLQCCKAADVWRVLSIFHFVSFKKLVILVYICFFRMTVRCFRNGCRSLESHPVHIVLTPVDWADISCTERLLYMFFPDRSAGLLSLFLCRIRISHEAAVSYCPCNNAAFPFPDSGATE